MDEIRDEFRRNMGETQSEKIEKMLHEARVGLKSLQQQCGMNTGTDIQYMYDEALQRDQKR